MPKFIPQRKTKIKWSSNFAYAIGLITSDGNLSPDKRHVSFISTDYQLVHNLKVSLNLKNRIKKRLPKNKRHKTCFVIQFGDIEFYRFLNQVGLQSAKSKIIKQIKVPKKFFADFLRGVFEGDGTFYTFYDKRWPSSFGYQISFSSASLFFVKWLKQSLTNFYKVKGFICKGKGIYNLRYVKRDTKKLYSAMYCSKKSLLLNRKYIKIKKSFLKDKRLTQPD